MNEVGKLVIQLLFEDSDFRKGLKQAQQAITGLSGNLGGLADGINRRVTTAFKAGAIAVGGFVSAAALIGATFDREIRTVGAVLGESEEGFRRVSDEARRLGATTQFTATQAATALTNFARAGFDSFETVSAAGPALDLATAAASELNLATAALSNSLSQFGLDAEQSARVSDVLANAVTRTKFDLEGLNDAMKTAGPTGKSAALSLEQTVAAVAQFRELGVDASTAGVLFRNTIQRLVAPSSVAATAIEGLGLSLDQVDPTIVGFDKALLTLREAGLTARSASQIFGRFGLQIQSVAGIVDDADKGYAALTARFEQETGRAAKIAAEASDNVFTQFQILASAVQELFLSVFDTIRAPILTVFNALTELTGAISKRFQQAAGGIEVSAQGIADAIARFLGNNADAIADSFVAMAEAIVAVISNLETLVNVVQTLSPLLSALFGIFAENASIGVAAGGLALVSTRMASLGASAFSAGANLAIIANTLGVSIPTAATAAATAMRAFAASVVTSTGGIAALAAGVGLLVAGLVTLAAKTRDATRAQFALNASKAGESEANRRQAEELATLAKNLEAQKKAAREVLHTYKDLTPARRNELNAILDLNAETLGQGLDSGRIVQFGDQFQFVSAAVRELGEEGVEALKNAAAESQRTGEELTTTADQLREKVKELQDLQSRVGDSAVSDSAREAAARDIAAIINQYASASSEVGNIQRRIQLQVEQNGKSSIDALVGEANAAASLLDTLGTKSIQRSGAVLTATTRAIILQDEERTKEAKQNSDLRIKQAKDEARAIEGAAGNIDAARKGLEGILSAAQQSGVEGEAGRIRAILDAQLIEIEGFNQEIAEKFSGSAAELAELTELGAQARLAVERNAASQLRAIEVSAAEDIQRIRREGADAYAEAVGGELSEANRIRRAGLEAAKVLEQKAAEEIEAVRLKASAAGGGEEARALAAEVAAVEVLAIEERLAGRRLAVLRKFRQQADEYELSRADAVLQNFQQQAERFAQAVQDANQGAAEDAIRAGGPIARAASFLQETMRRAYQKAFEKNPGLTNSLTQAGKLIGELGKVGGQIFDAALKTAKGVVGVFDKLTGGFISGFDISSIIGSITQEVDAAREAVRAAEDALNAGTGTVDALTDARRALTAAEATLRSGESASAVVDRMVQQALDFTRALAGSLGSIIQSLIDQLPGLVDEVSRTLVSVVDTIVDRLPDLTTTAIAAADQFVAVLVAKLPDLLRSIVGTIAESSASALGALGDIVSAIVDTLPDLIGSFLNQLPDVIGSLLGAVDDIIAALLRAIPEIVTNIGDQLSGLLTGIVRAVFNLIFSLLRELPTFGAALLQAFPNLLADIIKAVIDLVTVVVGEIPRVVEALVEGIIESIPELVTESINRLFSEFPRIFAELTRSITFELTPALLTLPGKLVEVLVDKLVPAIGNLFTQLGDSIAAWWARFKDNIRNDLQAGAMNAGMVLLTVLTGGIFEFFRRISEAIDRAIVNAKEKAAEAGRDVGKVVGNTILDILTGGISYAIRRGQREYREGNATGGQAAGRVTSAILSAGVTEIFRGLGRAGGNNEIPEGGGASAAGGLDFVQRTARTLVHPGEAILTAEQNRRRLFKTRAPNPVAPITSGGFEGGQGGGGGVTELRVYLGDEEVDRYMVAADGRGGANLANKSQRRKTGSRVALRRRS